MEEYLLPTTSTAGTPCTLATSFSPTPVGIGGLDFDLAGSMVVTSTFTPTISNIDGPPFGSLVGSSFPLDAEIEDITIKSRGCVLRLEQPEDSISMNTIVSKGIAKTVHAEKQVFVCVTEQRVQVIVDLTTIAEIYESMDLVNGQPQAPIMKQVEVITCLKGLETAQVVSCDAIGAPTDAPIPLTGCRENFVGQPQEMNTVVKGNVVKTIESQKEVFLCDVNTDQQDDKKVDIVVFSEVWEKPTNLEEDPPLNPVILKTFQSMRCLVNLQTSLPEVESCIFSDVPT